MPKTSFRWLATALCAAALGGLSAAVLPVGLAADAPAREKTQTSAKAGAGQLTLESLGELLGALGLKATRNESRYDFEFASKQGDEWNFTMSVVLSKDERTLWIMAWLDELPKSSKDVPHKALLRLLADNDLMGNGLFFSYIPENRRIVLQRVIPNENVSTAAMRGALVELGTAVVGTFDHWSVANWKTPATGKVAEGAGDPAAKSTKDTASPKITPGAGTAPTRTAESSSSKSATIRK